MYIAINFDGTCTSHGEDVSGCIETLKDLINEGHQIILWTIRSGKLLNDAVNWFREKEIPLFGVNENPANTWSISSKVYAEFYIDVSAIGCPVKYYKGKKQVDWKIVRKLLGEQGVLPVRDLQEFIIETVCIGYKITFEDLYTHKNQRYRKYLRPRQVIYYLLKFYMRREKSLNDLGVIFRQSHATVLSAIKVVQNMIDTEKDFSCYIREMMHKIDLMKSLWK